MIRLRDDTLMEDAARKVAVGLSLSGLHGLDFVLANDTGVPWLIEINNRPTQTAYLRLGPGADLAGALYAAMTKTTAKPVGVFKAQQVIALFDQPSDPRPRPSDDRVPLPEMPPTPVLPQALKPVGTSAVLSP